MDTVLKYEPCDVARLRERIGTIVGRSRWRIIDQEMINQFADLICDHQYIHVDPDRAKTTPYGTTVAHGFLTLSILGGLAGEVAPRVTGTVMGVNYGFDRVRFVAPVRSGHEVRATLVLKEVEQPDEKTVAILYEATLEVDDEEKPAVVALWRVRAYL
jgi:acyl dehydratase